jgi:Amt family ammonium transporter
MNSRGVNAVIVTNLSASVGGLTWMFAEMIKHRRGKLSLNGFCSGAIAGLVTVTPAAGFIRPHFALVFGFLGAIVCLFACDLKKITRFRCDDACDAFGSKN